MAILFKNLQKSVSNLRFGNSSILNYLLGNEQKLLLKRIHGKDIPYFSVLSPPNFSSTKHNYRLPHFEEFKVVAGSCNGLVCLDNTLDSNLLWNPSTGESQVILSTRLLGTSPIPYNQHSFSCGFGYDSDSKHFKFIRFVYSFEQDGDGDSYSLQDQEIELYDLNRDSWRFLDHPGPGHFVFRNPSIYINGYNYWLAYDKGRPYIRSFDFASEGLHGHDLPDVVYSNSKRSSLCFDFVDFKGEFGVIVSPKCGSDKSFELWLSNGYTWIKEYEFCVPGAQRPLGFWDDGKLMFFEGMDGQLVVCDINTGKTTIKLDMHDRSGKMQLFPYVESDVSIKGLLGTSKAPPSNMKQSRGANIRKAS